jgi:3',5'-cyclic AMP phosphodiesterase CpdA
MRLAHCSDLHLLSLDGARVLDFANKRWIGGMNLITNRGRHYHTEAFEDMIDDLNALGIEHVLCSGDITNLGLEQEFHFARGLFDRLALGPAGVTVLPGNHDAYVAAGGLHFSAIFRDYVAADPDWAWDDGDRDPWPVVRVRGPLAVIGLSTSLQTPWFTAWGKIGPRQLERLGRALGDPRLAGKARIVAIHHPPAGRRATSRIRGLRDHAELAELLARHGASVVIHGHEHRNLLETLPVPGGTVDVLGVPSGTYHAADPSRTARYRVFEIDDSGQLLGHHLRVWHRDRRRFDHDSSPPPARVASA